MNSNKSELSKRLAAIARPSSGGELKSLYQSLLGDAFHSLPPAVRELHSHTELVTYIGRGSVERGVGLLSRVVGALMRFPPATPDTSVSVCFDISDGVEIWARQFGEHRFQSRLSASGEELCESFGWVRIRFKLTADETGLRMFPVRWTALGIPLPKMCWPSIVAHESETQGRFQFFVEASLPVAGFVVRYRGHLQRATP